jgi:4-amino-4-deoxy-L-arabinose transferase-like glycosyltransferase
MLGQRCFDHALIVAVGALLFLPNLGSHSLWDEDEAHNAQCVQEMVDAGTWVVPTFNFRLRSDKPILQYWTIRCCYLLFGPGEWSARLPSALASLLSLLLCYELGRALFDRGTGVVSALLLASSILFCMIAHAVTPDALLVATTMAAFTAFAVDYRRGSTNWLITSSVASAFAVLAKGPVGLVLPLGIVGIFLFWQRQLRQFWNWKLLVGALLFTAIAAPWYIRVGIDTRFEFIRGFFLRHNVERFQSAMEGHGAGVWFHPLCLFVTFAPASVFLLLATWHAWRGEAPSYSSEARSWRHHLWDLLRPLTHDNWAYRFLATWILVWVGFFSLAATKLPNYLLPAFPALAVLVGRFLVRWMRGDVRLPLRLERTAWACFALVGVVIGAGMVMASGTMPWNLIGRHEVPSVFSMAAIGIIPVVFAWACARVRRQGLGMQALAGLLAGSCLAVGALAAFVPIALERHRAIKTLAQRLNAEPLLGDRLIGCHDAYHPSLVYYVNRPVMRSLSDRKAIELLNSPWPAFLVIREKDWQRVGAWAPRSCTTLAQAYDFKAGDYLLLIYNHGKCSVGAPLASSDARRFGHPPQQTLTHVQHSGASDSR